MEVSFVLLITTGWFQAHRYKKKESLNEREIKQQTEGHAQKAVYLPGGIRLGT